MTDLALKPDETEAKAAVTRGWIVPAIIGSAPVSYTHLTLPTNREV